jgi:hypothetical protein
MSKGYVILAQDNYVDMAILLAKSIKTTQSTVNNVSLITDNTCDSAYFDHVIPITGDNVMYNRTQIYNLSPYDETVMLDADMLFLSDVSHWWDHFSKYELLITNKVNTYRGDPVTSTAYRKTFVSNELANCYSAFTYFKKSTTAEEFFNLLSIIINDWDNWTMRYAPEDRQSWPSIDVAMGIAVKILDVAAFSPLDYPTFTHLKSGCQGWSNFSEDWRTHIGLYVSGNQLRLGNHIQSGILHYVDKKVLNELLHLL